MLHKHTSIEGAKLMGVRQNQCFKVRFGPYLIIDYVFTISIKLLNLLTIPPNSPYLNFVSTRAPSQLRVSEEKSL